MSFAGLPSWASWRHQGLREGFEIALFDVHDDRLQIRGATTAVEAGAPFRVDYRIDVDASWRTRAAVVESLTRDGTSRVRLECDTGGLWRVDGAAAVHLDGCVDLDLEASALTNMLPVHRLALTIDQAQEVPAAYVRVNGRVERLEQVYRRDTDEADERRYTYSAPQFDFVAQLRYAGDGLVNEYPGLARRSD